MIIKWECFFLFFFFKGDLKNKLKKGKLCMNNSKVIANSINHRDYRLDNDYINQNEDDTIRWLSFSVLWSFMFFSFFFFGSLSKTIIIFLFFSFLMENYISFLSVLFYFLFGICAVINHMAAIKIGRSRTKVIRGAWIHWMEKKRRMRAKKIWNKKKVNNCCGEIKICKI